VEQELLTLTEHRQRGILELFPRCGIFCFSFYYKKSLKIPKGGNQNPYIEEEQTTQWPKEEVQKDKTIYKAYT
jgi:hypothetical protein